MTADEGTTAERTFARRLASVDAKKRRLALKGLNAWLSARAAKGPMPMLELRKLWRSLFFCMWLADKAPVQNDLAQKLGALVHCFDTPEAVALWIEVMGRTLREEWPKLDKYRIDKYYVLIRHSMHEVFAWLAKTSWAHTPVETVGAAIYQGLIAHVRPNGIRLHVADILSDELFRAGAQTLDTASLLLLIDPVLAEMSKTEDAAFFRRVLNGLVLDLISKCSSSDESDGDDSIYANVDMLRIQSRLFELASSSETRDKYREQLYSAHRQFQQVSGKRAAAAAAAPAPGRHDARGSSNVNDASDEAAAPATAEGTPKTKKRKLQTSEAVRTAEVADAKPAKKRLKKKAVATAGPETAVGAEVAPAAKAVVVTTGDGGPKAKKRKTPILRAPEASDAKLAKKRPKKKTTATATAPAPVETVGAGGKKETEKRRVSFGVSRSKEYTKSVKDLKKSTPGREEKPTRGALKAPPTRSPTNRPKASDFF